MIEKNICKICGYVGSRAHSSLSRHIKTKHLLSIKDYFDGYLKSELNSRCGFCGDYTNWSERHQRYNLYCSLNCRSKNIVKDSTHIEKLVTGRRKWLSANLEYFRSSTSKHMLIRWKDPGYREEMKKINSLGGVAAMEKYKGSSRRGKRVSHKGYLFRSTWEYEFAVLCEQNNLKYQFEPVWFLMEDNSRYLPDFYLSDLNVWVEIKPKKFQNEKLQQRKEFLEKNGYSLIVLDQAEFQNFFARN